MNTPIGESGVTPHRALGELVRLGPEAADLPRLGFEAMRDWTGTDFRRRQGVVERLQAHLSHMGVPEQNPFYGSTRTLLIPTEQPRIQKVLLSAGSSARAVRDSAAELADALRLASPATASDAALLREASRRVAQAPRLEGVRVRSGEWQAHQDELRELVQAGERYSELRDQYDELLIPEAWDQDLLETRQTPRSSE